MTQTEAAKKEAGDAPPQNIKEESPNVSSSKKIEKNSRKYFRKFQRTNPKLAKERNCPNSVGSLVNH